VADDGTFPLFASIIVVVDDDDEEGRLDGARSE
jgi:hypothetical protein